MNLAVVIAACNQARNIGKLTGQIVRLLDASPNPQWTLTCITSGTDGGDGIARQAAESRANVTVLHSVRPESPDEAFRRGLASIPGQPDVVVSLDASRGYPPSEIVRLAELLHSRQADIVVGGSVDSAPGRNRGLASRALDSAIRAFTAAPVQDMTSGIQVYRAEILRRSDFAIAGFECQPEILLWAHRAGLKIVEEPVRATRDHQPVEVSRFQRFLWPVFGLAMVAILVGIPARVVLAYPPQQNIADADSVLAGVCGNEVLNGKFPFFLPGGYRLSSQSCYYSAALSWLAGPSRATLATLPLVYGVLTFVFIWLGLRRALGDRAAGLGALLVAFPPLQYLYVTTILGYPEIMMWSACSLWLGFVLLFRPPARPVPVAAAFGLAVGLAFWSSPQSLMVTAPLLLVMLIGGAFRSLPVLAVTAAGGVLGLFAYIAVIARQGIAPFTSSFATKPVDSTEGVLANLTYGVSSVLPEFLLNSQLPPSSQMVAVLSLIIPVGVLAVVALLGWRLRADKAAALRTPVVLCALLSLLVIVFSLGLYSVSGAGSVRGWTVRYLAPIFFALPLAAATLLAAAPAGMMARAVTLATAMVCIANAWAYPWPGTADRQARQVALQRDYELVDWLRQNGRNTVMGDFWLTSRLNYGFGRDITGIPVPLFFDYIDQRARLRNPVTLALIDADPNHLNLWMRRAGLTGRIAQAPGGAWVLLADGWLDPGLIDAIAGAGN